MAGVGSEEALGELEDELSAATLAALREHLQGASKGREENEMVEGLLDEPAKARDTNGTASARLPANTVYSRRDFWEERFRDEDDYEWLLGWRQLEAQLRPFLHSEARVLVIGCGSSSLSSDLYDAGFRCVTSIDFSEVIIEKMRQRHKDDRPELRWDVMDMTALKYADATFDVVIDKAAMDAIMVDEGDVWDPADVVKEKADAMCRRITQILRPSGIFLMISFMQPHFRRWYLLSRERLEESHLVGHSASYGWSVEHEDIAAGDGGGGLGNFLYICRKAVAATRST